MSVRHESPNSLLVRCSDGWGAVDLSDLEFMLAIKTKSAT
jgi:hypothetical protein